MLTKLQLKKVYFVNDFHPGFRTIKEKEKKRGSRNIFCLILLRANAIGWV